MSASPTDPSTPAPPHPRTSAPSPVGRFAPSPTGALHLGNLRTALAAWLWTRHNGGRFLVRVEDLDGPRAKPGCEQRQLDDLRALGIDWDDEPWRQSQRADVYRGYLDRLLEAGIAYPCFCSRKDVRAAASAPHASDGVVAYPGTCRHRTPEDVAARVARGEQHSLRVRFDVDEGAMFDDAFAGPVSLALATREGDFVVRRADGIAAYQLACAVDDALSGVTEVVRGGDLLDSGMRQQWLLQRLGFTPPRYAHLPLLRGADGRRLSKRDGDDDLAHFLAHGYDAVGVASYLACTLGQCAPGERLSPAQLVPRFDAARIPRADTVFDAELMASFRPPAWTPPPGRGSS